MTRTGIPLVSAVSPQHSAFGQGSLTPPGAPAPTLMTRQPIEPRTPLRTLPVVITQPGSYYLTNSYDLGPGQNGIVLLAHNVTVDLYGFTIGCDGQSSTMTGLNSFIVNSCVAVGLPPLSISFKYKMP